MPILVKAISSMATRQVLADMAQAWQAAGGAPLALESVGGVDAAQRVQAGETFDAVFLASNAIDKLIAAGHVVADSKRDLVVSSTAVAVPAGATLPDISSEAALREAVLAASSIGYSTGPSGVALQALFARWGIAQQVQERLKQAPPGVPVAQLLAQGDVTLGFQQLSELLHALGIHIVGNLPQTVAIDTVFSGAVVAGSVHAEAVQQMLAFMASPATEAVKRAQGMAAA